MPADQYKPEALWHVVVVVNPVTTLIAEAWLEEHKISPSHIICLSERGFQVPVAATWSVKIWTD